MTAQSHDFVPGGRTTPPGTCARSGPLWLFARTVRRSTPGSRRSWTRSGWISISAGRCTGSSWTRSPRTRSAVCPACKGY